MKKKKLLLINPVEGGVEGLNTQRSTNMPPLSLAYVAALTPRDDWDIDIIDENFDVFEFKNADLVALTSFTCNISRAYEIATVYKKANIRVVIGGIHASMIPDEALEYCDTVVVGDANSVWETVISDFQQKKLKNKYYGDTMDLDSLVSPDTEIFNKNYIWGTLLTSRGCPMNCDFCSVTKFCGSTYRQRPVQSVVKEFSLIDKKNILFLDDNILGYGPKAEDRAVELFRGIAELKLNRNIFCQASINVADSPEVLKSAAKAGVKILLIGFESTNEDSLRAMNKMMNLKSGVQNYKDKIRNIQSYGIAVWGCFIIGNDHDKPDVFDSLYKTVVECNIDVLQISHSTPLPATNLFERIVDEDRLLYRNFPSDWKGYTFTNAMYKPRNLSLEELENGYLGLREKYFKYKNIVLRTLRTLLNTRNVKTAIIAYLLNDSFRKRTARRIMAAKAQTT